MIQHGYDNIIICATKYGLLARLVLRSPQNLEPRKLLDRVDDVDVREELRLPSDHLQANIHIVSRACMHADPRTTCQAIIIVKFRTVLQGPFIY